MKQRVARRTETRREIIKFFGEKCGVCGFNNVKALQIDHKIGGGTKEMKQMKESIKRCFSIQKNSLKSINSYVLIAIGLNVIKTTRSK